MIKPYFSIITVVKNGEKTLGNTIESVLSQNYTNYEYIVIAGENSDGTDEVLSHYHKHIDIIRSEKDEGIYFAMNKGLKVCSGKYINFLIQATHTNVLIRLVLLMVN